MGTIHLVTRASKNAFVDLHSVLILKNSISVHFIFLPIIEYKQNRTEIDSKKCRSGYCIVFRSLFLFVVDIFAFDPRPSYLRQQLGSVGTKGGKSPVSCTFFKLSAEIDVLQYQQ